MNVKVSNHTGDLLLAACSFRKCRLERQREIYQLINAVKFPDIVSVNFSSVQFSTRTESKHVKNIMEHMVKILKVLYSYH